MAHTPTQRRSFLKWLAALPFVGVMVPNAARSDTPALDEGCRRQIIAYRARAYWLPGLWGIRQDNPELPSMDLIVSDGGLDLLVERPFIFEDGDRWQAVWIARHRMCEFAEIEDETFKNEFYPRLKKIMERYS